MKNVFACLTASLLLSSLCAQWSTDPQNPNLIAGFPAEQVMPKVAICDNGNTYICRFDNNGGSYKVYLNLLAADGTPVWTSPQGQLISEHNQMSWLTEYDLTVDNDGNAVIVFQDIRNAGANNVVAYKISPQQGFLWGADGIALSADTNPDFGNMSPVVFNSNDSNTYVAWQRMGTTTSTVIQCLSPAGQKLWTDNGIVLTPPAGSYTWPQIIQSDFDNILLKYYHDTGPVWAPTRHTYVAKYSPGGIQSWNTLITNAGGLTAWQQLIPFEPDGMGGGILAWYEDRENDMDTDIYAQRVTAAGAVSMPANGALVSVDPANQQYYPQVAVDRENQQLYVFFRVTDANQNSWGLGRQMLDFAGNRLWGETAPLFVNIGGLEANPVGAFYTGYGAVCHYELNDQLYAECWRASGAAGWLDTPVAIALTGGSKYHFDSAGHPDQWGVVTWEQGTADMDIYAMRLNGNGSIGTLYLPPRQLSATLLPPDTVQLDWQAPSLFILPDSYYVYINGELGQTVPGNVLSYQFDELDPGNYEFWVKARYGDHYSANSDTVTVAVVAADDPLCPELLSQLRLSPNPWTAQTSLSFILHGKAQSGRISVYDLRGRLITRQELQARTGFNELGLRSLGLILPHSGIYLLKLELGAQTHIFRTVYTK